MKTKVNFGETYFSAVSPRLWNQLPVEPIKTVACLGGKKGHFDNPLIDETERYSCLHSAIDHLAGKTLYKTITLLHYLYAGVVR